MFGELESKAIYARKQSASEDQLSEMRNDMSQDIQEAAKYTIAHARGSSGYFSPTYGLQRLLLMNRVFRLTLSREPYKWLHDLCCKASLNSGARRG